MKHKLNVFQISRLMSFIRSYRKTIVWMIILGIFSSLADSLYPLFNSYALDHFVALNDLDGLSAFIALYIGLMILQEADNFYCLFECGKIEMSMDRDLRDASFNHLQTLSFSYFSQNNVGYIHARVMSDTAKIDELISWRMMDIVWNVSYIVAILIIMFSIDIRLACMVLILVPFAIIIIMIFQKKLVVLNRQVRDMNSKVTSDFNEGITGIASIKTLVIEKKMIHEFKQDTQSMYHISVKTSRHAAFLSSSIVLFSSIALALVLWQGGMLTQAGFFRIGTLSVFMSYAVGMLDPIQSIITTFSSLIAIQVNIERFMDLLETQTEVTDSKAVIQKYGDAFHPKKENWEPLIGYVQFEDVTFRYPDGKENVLEHLNSDVPQGTNVAIVGETGAGKSTLVNLVCRFYEPNEGKILIDGKDAKARSQLWLVISGMSYRHRICFQVPFVTI